MTRRKKPSTLGTMERGVYLIALGDMRHAIIKGMSTLHPTGPDYKVLASFLSSLDRHQEHFSGDPAYFHLKPAPSIGMRAEKP